MKKSRLSLLGLVLCLALASTLVPVPPAEACFTCGSHTPPWGDPPEAFCVGDAGLAGWFSCLPQSSGGCVMFFRCSFFEVSCD